MKCDSMNINFKYYNEIFTLPGTAIEDTEVMICLA